MTWIDQQSAVIVLLIDCPASVALVAATGRSSAVARSFRLRQSALTCPPTSCIRNIVSPLQGSLFLPLLWMVVVFRLEVTVAVELRWPFLAPSPCLCLWAWLPVASALVHALLRAREIQDFVSRLDLAVQPCSVAYEMIFDT